MLLGAPGGPWVEFFVDFGSILGPFWVDPGSILDAFGRHLGRNLFFSVWYCRLKFFCTLLLASTFSVFCRLHLCVTACCCSLEQAQANVSNQTQPHLPQAGTSNHKALQATTGNQKQQQLPQESTSNHKHPFIRAFRSLLLR